MRETEQCEQKKEKKWKEKEKNVFSTRCLLRRNIVVKSRFLPHCSPHYHPSGVYIGWVEMWDANGAIELTVVDEFSLRKLWMVLLKPFLGVRE